MDGHPLGDSFRRVPRSGSQELILCLEAVAWRPLATPCFVRPSCSSSGQQPKADGSGGEPAYQEEGCIAGSPLQEQQPNLPDMLDIQGSRRAEWVQAACLARDADALVCNLFAMPPTYHLSERLNVPWLCCSPCFLPYSLPDNFEAELAANMPDLLEELKRREAQLNSSSHQLVLLDPS